MDFSSPIVSGMLQVIALGFLWWNTRTALRFLPFRAARQFARYGSMALVWFVIILRYIFYAG